jgi:uncharacterized membrane protein
VNKTKWVVIGVIVVALIAFAALALVLGHVW